MKNSLSCSKSSQCNCDCDQVLERCVRDGSVALQTALEYATNRNNFSLHLQDWVASQKQAAAPATNGGATIQIEKY